VPSSIPPLGPPEPAPPPASPAAAIEVSDLVIRYGDHVAVDHLSFEVAAGSVVALLGPNGAGKTSTVECLEGYRRPASGRVRVLGLDPQAQHDQLTRRIGVMLQNGGVYTGIRPPEALALFASYYDDPADPEELLERVGLTARRRSTWKTLSGGEQQRLSLALALVGRPQVAFLDEPTSGIDPSGRQLIRRVIAELRQSGVTVLLTTHDLEEAEKLADRVVIIDRGRVLAAGTPAELTRSSQSDEFRFAAQADLDVSSLGTAIGAQVVEVAPGEYRVDGAPEPTRVAALTGWLADRDLPLGDLRAGRQRLEDVFLRLTESAAATDAAARARADTDAPADSRGRRSRRARRSSR
jgi:ABC-2 type transport system ATP-binding protein